MLEIVEFKKLPFTRDEDYFNDGYASWEVQVNKRTYTVNAIYFEMEMYKNEYTKDYTNGVMGFEVRDYANRKIKEFKYKASPKILSLLEVEEFLINEVQH